ncbi:hypothetical protein F5Y19DRAFT_346994 [Xylariaceae sp. FL1651]|nr:hypothetical protein F5Y19DRAFT_346994 [Xylariaceae sp. FL1651]
MASTIPVSSARGVGDKSRSRRVGALLDMSRGEPPLTTMKRNLRKEPEKSIPTVPVGSGPRALTSRIPQNPAARKLTTQTELKLARPPLTHETQSWSTSSNSRSTMVKSSTASGAYAEPTKQPRNVLRRKQSTLLKEPANIHVRNPSRSDSGRTGSSSSIPRSQLSLDPTNSFSDRSITESPVEIRVAQQVEALRPVTQPTRIYPELDRYRDIQVPPSRDALGRDALYRLATEDLPPPTPQFSGASSHSQLSTFSASPSTRFSESPGTGPYSRDTTPTSMCSQSPGLVAPIRLPAARVRQASPAETRPPVTRRRAGSVSNEGGSFSADPQGLAAVREALTSSSSNSTVRTEEKNSKIHRGRAPAPPNPPPRKSSQKFKKDRSTDETPLSLKSSWIPAQPVMRSPSPNKLTKPLPDRAPGVAPSPQLRPTPPSRPSRDGTPDLYSHFGGPVPIVHSNLSSTSLTERRQSGQLQPSSLPRSNTPSSSQDRTGSARPSLNREPTPAPQPSLPTSSQVGKVDTGKVNKAPSPSAPTFKSKFPLFGRRTKAGPEEAQKEKKKERVSKKGPAAGTGHEGYGRIGAVKRRSSTVSNLQRGHPGPISSSESLVSTLSTDPFLLERMNPVIIAGGEVVENRNTSSDLVRTESSQSAPWSRPSLESRNHSASSLGAKEDSRQTLWPSPFLGASIHSRRPSDGSDSEMFAARPTLAYRRSIRGLQSQDSAPFNIPKPISTRAPSAASMATTIYTDDSFPDIQSEQDLGRPQASASAKKLTKRAKSPRKWNIFGRSQINASPKKQVEKGVSATLQPSQTKSVAFYTIMDSPEQEVIDDGRDINVSLGEAEVLPAKGYRLDHDRSPLTSSRTTQLVQLHPTKKHSDTIPQSSDTVPRIWQIDTKKEKSEAHHTISGSSTGRPSRLPQVGRIPKVVTTRPEQTSPKSFSRPFNRISIQLPPAESVHPDQDSIAKGPSPPESLAPRAMRTGSPAKPALPERVSRDMSLHIDSPDLGQPSQEFLTFPPRNNSECTVSSDSSSFGASGYVAHTARIPEPSAPLGEDEVWDEYNDLLEDAPPSSTSSCGIPFPLEAYHSKLAKKPMKPLESPTIITELVQDVRDSVATAKTATASSHYSADMTARINAAFRFDSDPPTTPFSVSEFVSGYSDRNNNKVQSSQGPNASTRNSSSSNQSEKIKAGSKRSSGSSRLSEETPLSQVNLRVGSMTVSKWLTFGHVLFSPVREDLVNDGGSLKRQSILVVDGLGNDDWSFYAAETYPAATFFNLSPRAPLPKEHQTTASFPLSPPNHHQIQFTSHADKFPFGPDSFTAIVFRFPSAAPEAHYRNIISEARRVLKPGGFIELSILDVDLNNMGNRTRRAVRRLKERVNARNTDLNLSSTADLILRLLGKKGFVDIKTCRVGVPVASSVANASSKDGKKDERSLAEMMNDDTELGDENITKMVSKVGRWWYNRCYEVSTGMTSSIWNDRALLAECEEWGTSLKLMVCHARIPEARGRVASI